MTITFSSSLPGIICFVLLMLRSQLNRSYVNIVLLPRINTHSHKQNNVHTVWNFCISECFFFSIFNSFLLIFFCCLPSHKVRIHSSNHTDKTLWLWSICIISNKYNDDNDNNSNVHACYSCRCTTPVSLYSLICSKTDGYSIYFMPFSFSALLQKRATLHTHCSALHWLRVLTQNTYIYSWFFHYYYHHISYIYNINIYSFISLLA